MIKKITNAALGKQNDWTKIVSFSGAGFFLLILPSDHVLHAQVSQTHQRLTQSPGWVSACSLRSCIFNFVSARQPVETFTTRLSNNKPLASASNKRPW